MKKYHLQHKSQRAKVTPVKEKEQFKNYYRRLTCHEQFENSSRLGVQNGRHPDPHICIVQSDRLVSKCVMGTWLQFAYVSKRTISSNILLLQLSSPRKFVILHPRSGELRMQKLKSHLVRTQSLNVLPL